MSMGLRTPGGGFRQILVLLGGSGLAQLIALAASPVLSRLYSPEHFGAFALFLSLATLLATVACGRYEYAMLLPAQDAEAGQLLGFSVCLALTFSGFLALLQVLGLNDAIVARLGDLALGAWLWLLPVAVLALALSNAVSVWRNRQQAYRLLATSRVLQSGTTAFVGVGLGLAAWGSLGLVLANLIGQLLGLLSLLRGGALPRSWRCWQALRTVAIKYKDFPVINLPHALMDALQATALLWVLGVWYGATAVGAYAFALRIARAPLTMLSGSVGQVYQQRSAQAHANGHDLRAVTRRTVRGLVGMALPFLIAMVWAPELFAIAFGERWRAAGEIAHVLAPWMASNFVTSPLSQLPRLLKRQGAAFAFGLLYQAALLLSVLGAGWMSWPLLDAMALLSCCGSVVLVAYGLWTLRLIRSAV